MDGLTTKAGIERSKNINQTRDDPSRKRLLAWLFRLGTEPRQVHWCLLCLVTWHVAFGFTL